MPLTLGLLVDTSYSQRGVIQDERGASYTFLDHMLGEKDRAFVIHFDHEVELLQDLTSSRPKLQAALQQLDPSPRETDTADDDNSGARRHAGTLLYDAVFLASNELTKKQQGRKAIFVLSDGVDRGSKKTLEDAVEAAQRADTSVYSIYFPGQEGQTEHAHHGGFGGGHGGWGMGGPWPGGGPMGGPGARSALGRPRRKVSTRMKSGRHRRNLWVSDHSHGSNARRDSRMLGNLRLASTGRLRTTRCR